jgi:hypothetical protein
MPLAPSGSSGKDKLRGNEPRLNAYDARSGLPRIWCRMDASAVAVRLKEFE